MKIAIINGPNLNLLGQREPEVYGNQTFESFMTSLREQWPKLDLEYYQSNVEGDLIDKLHELGFSAHGIVLNAGGYTHTSVALSDAVAAITTPVIEVHISNIHARETYRHQSLVGKNCVGMIAGFGLGGYQLALEYLVNYQQP